ncbi:MAG: tetratricopeptide repeat protein [Candidatus Uhrbacteria bacterium]
MLFWLIPIIIFVLSLTVIIFVICRKIPQLRALNIETTVRAKVKQVKEAIILERIKRIRGKKLSKLIEQINQVFRRLSRFGRRSIQRLMALEKYYQELKEAPVNGSSRLDSEAIDRMLKEAGELVRQEKYSAAEKKYVEIISHDAKNIRAFEDLGRLYIRMKEPAQARETFNFILSFKPDDASVLVSLGEIALEEDEKPLALDYFERAVAKRPHNPKYLDYLTDTALKVQEIEPARRGIDSLKEVNPENKKIADFEARLRDIDVTPTSSSQGK